MRRLALFLLLCCAADILAQEDVSAGDPTFVPTVKVGKVLDRGDSIQYMEMSNVYVYPGLEFKNLRSVAEFNLVPSRKAQADAIEVIRNEETIQGLE